MAARNGSNRPGGAAPRPQLRPAAPASLRRRLQREVSVVHKVFVDVELQDVRVSTRDVVFKVYRKNSKFGELRVSAGAVVWRGRADKLGRKLSWARFDDLMQSSARRAERRPPKARVSVSRKKRRQG